MFKYYLMTIIVLFLDQISKWSIATFMELHDSYSVIGDFFHISSQRNSGAAFGILQNQRLFFIIVTTFVVIGIIIYLYKMAIKQQRLLSVGLSLLLGGALGNFIDRLRMGEVVDFLQFRFQFSIFGKQIDYYFATFNLADSAIVIGVGIIMLDLFIQWRNEKKQGAESNATS